MTNGQVPSAESLEAHAPRRSPTNHASAPCIPTAADRLSQGTWCDQRRLSGVWHLINLLLEQAEPASGVCALLSLPFPPAPVLAWLGGWGLNQETRHREEISDLPCFPSLLLVSLSPEPGDVPGTLLSHPSPQPFFFSLLSILIWPRGGEFQ